MAALRQTAEDSFVWWLSGSSEADLYGGSATDCSINDAPQDIWATKFVSHRFRGTFVVVGFKHIV